MARNLQRILHSDSSTMPTLQQTILEKKAALADAVSAPLARLADRVAEVWPDADAIDQRLQEAFTSLPNCHLAYAWNVNGIEVSSMVRAKGPDPTWRGRDLSQRPYLKNHLPFKGVMLSSVYLSEYTYEFCLTALQAVSRDNQLLGFIAADFAVNDLLRDDKLAAVQEVRWKQFRGDPSVRGTVFMQTRAHSVFDEHINEAIEGIAMLMREHGVFHSKIHFSSGRCSFWLYDDPYNYRLHGVEEIIDPELCLAYPVRAYPEKAKTPALRGRDHLPALRVAQYHERHDRPDLLLRRLALHVGRGISGPRHRLLVGYNHRRAAGGAHCQLNGVR
jgi:hypothetical protein